jgi:hypothetical protein
MLHFTFYTLHFTFFRPSGGRKVPPTDVKDHRSAYLSETATYYLISRRRMQAFLVNGKRKK